MLIEKILDIISKFHHYKISLYAKKLGCNTLIDVGSHKGEFLNSFLKIKIFKKFYCFEPQKEIYKNLKKKFKNNKKVKLYNHSLGENESKKKMYLSNLTSLSTMSKINQKSNWFKIKNLIVRDKNRINMYQIVNQKKIDTVFKNISLKNSFLKIDVEGFDLLDQIVDFGIGQGRDHIALSVDTFGDFKAAVSRDECRGWVLEKVVEVRSG